MSKRKSRLAARKPIGSVGALAADLSKYGLNDRDESRRARNASDTMRAAKKWRQENGLDEPRRRKTED